MSLILIPPLVLFPAAFVMTTSEKELVLEHQTVMKQELKIDHAPDEVFQKFQTNGYKWDKDFFVIIQTFMTRTKGNPPEIFSTIIEKKNCQILGLVRTGSIRSILDRYPFKLQSPVKVRVQYISRLKEEAALEEYLVNQKYFVLDHKSSFYCNARMGDPASHEFPAKPHEEMELKIKESGPTLSIESRIVPAHLFNESLLVKKDIPKNKLQEAYPDIKNYLTQFIKNPSETSYKVLKRTNRFVYLEGGPLRGLTIGIRLVGPDKAKLHVVKYAVGFEGYHDVSIALIRHENESRPVKKDDIIEIDPTTFPKK